MNKEYLITIDGSHTADGGTERISLTTIGDYSRRDGIDYISYKETEATGFEGDTTTLIVEEGLRATLLRSGKTNSRLVIEKGQKHMCHYDTGFGSVAISVMADRIDNQLRHDGGKVRLRYSLDLNANALSVNELDITIKEARPHA